MQRVTQLQLVLLLILFHFSTATGFLMSPLASIASFQGWLVIIVANAGGLLVSYLSFVLGKQRASEFLVHYGKELVGKWFHIIWMVAFCFFFLHLASMVLREFTDFVIQIYLQSTPSWVIAAFFAFVVAIAVRSGLEAIFRCAAGFFFITIGAALIAPTLLGKEMNYNRTIAFLTHLDMGTLFSSSYPFIPWFGESFLILFIFPFLAKSEKTFRSLIVSSLVNIFLIDLYFVLCLLLFGAHLSGQLTYPVLEMIRFIRIGDFLENLDPIVVAIWMSSIFIKISTLLYMAVLITSQLFGLKDTRPFSFAFAAILLGLSIHLVQNTVELNHFLFHTWPSFGLVMECSPLIYLIMSYIKKRQPTLR
ncbi:endospore germination permease [Paenibacillus sp. N3.4]|uniref:GerAB/ArcD/ProY family transporter n=1 Tax=Paenibacillus sp. N3.4 TaxID=2603222 RepID=UPI0011CCD2EB|nr:endospore germination permease [Paenibacillus sp. N3.4]TXK83687.1 GerAB/ArcD/ProY family transporter [Paenibacillus sp. N3.4]